MRKQIERRLVDAERRLRSRSPAMIVRHIEGGFGGPLRCASANGFHWAQFPGEATEVFEERALAEAKAVRARTLVFGGSCDCVWADEKSCKAYLERPYFPKVPPEEPS